jgi:hypothetical protein
MNPELNDNIAKQNRAAGYGARLEAGFIEMTPRVAATEERIQAQLRTISDPNLFEAELRRSRHEDGKPESFAKAMIGTICCFILPAMLGFGLYVLVG